MKNLLLIICLFSIGIVQAQTDTTGTFIEEIETNYEPTILRESEFRTVKIVDYDATQDSTNWTTGRWILKDSIHVNNKTYKLQQIQFRMNDQGIKQRKQRTIRYTNTTRKRRKIVN